MKLETALRFAPFVGAAVLALGVVGCAGISSTVDRNEPSSTPSASSSSSGASAEATESASPVNSARVVRVTYKDGTVDPEFERVKIQAGSPVRIEVASDVADEVHLHGYDLSEAVGPGKPASISFEADDSGVFEVELEKLGVPLVELAIR